LPLAAELDLSRLEDTVKQVQSAALELDKEITFIRVHLNGEKKGCPRKLARKIQRINKKLQSFEGGFIDKKGLRGRTWYRSRVVAPGRLLGYGATTLPALTEAITLDRDVGQAKEEVEVLVKMFGQVAEKLRA
jgi:N-acetylated-alpha-linked acidic dipeptidase